MGRLAVSIRRQSLWPCFQNRLMESHRRTGQQGFKHSNFFLPVMPLMCCSVRCVTCYFRLLPKPFMQALHLPSLNGLPSELNHAHRKLILLCYWHLYPYDSSTFLFSEYFAVLLLIKQLFYHTVTIYPVLSDIQHYWLIFHKIPVHITSRWIVKLSLLVSTMP